MSILIKDNTTCKLSLFYRLNLENLFQTNDNQLKMNSCNLLRLVLDSNYFQYSNYKNDFLIEVINTQNFLNFYKKKQLIFQIIEKTIDISSPKHKLCLNAFTYLYLNNQIDLNDKLLKVLEIKKIKVKNRNNDKFNQIYPNKNNHDKSN